MLHTAHICVATEGVDALYDPWACKKKFGNLKEAREAGINANKLIFTLQFPHQGLEMSPWFQFIAGSLAVEVEYNPNNPYGTPGKVGKVHAVGKNDSSKKNPSGVISHCDL